MKIFTNQLRCTDLSELSVIWSNTSGLSIYMSKNSPKDKTGSTASYFISTDAAVTVTCHKTRLRSEAAAHLAPTRQLR